MSSTPNLRRRPDGTPVDHDLTWPLDVSLVTLSGLLLFLITSQLSFDDPRWLYNAWTYAIAVPLIAISLAVVMHFVAPRFIRKSVQIGFLFSVCLHLLLLILAIRVVIFASVTPHASQDDQKKRSPIKRTVPEHLFQAPRETAVTPDWSQPVEAQTASRVIPREQRLLPPVQRSQPKLEMPKPDQTRQPPMTKMLMKREEFTPAQPMPADSPSKLARRETTNPKAQPTQRPVQVPTPRPQSDRQAQASPTERQISRDRPQRSTSRRAPTRPEIAAPSPTLSPRQPDRISPAAAARNESTAMPRIGAAGMARQRQRQQSRRSSMRPAGAAPTSPTVAVARENPNASNVFSRADTPMSRRGETTGAQITAGDSPSMAMEVTPQASTGGASLARSDQAASSGVPSVEAGNARRAPGRASRASRSTGFAPAGAAPTPADSMAASSTGTDGAGASDQVADRMGIMDVIRAENAAGQSGSQTAALADAGAPGMALDVIADTGPVGLADIMSPSPGVTSADDIPEIAVFEITRAERPRRNVGGPTTPAGAKVAAVESFSRRVMRTRGGAAPTASGFAGPATEEAIELGLAYLASTQQADGSWSLQGHGDNVALRSDTAATGLCLLAFQGAGYTHKQHQYADTVRRALDFLKVNQRSDGCLYRSENEVSDRNVAFYSHGISALATSEAYGMTQDPELRDTAQRALDYIIETQHKKRGGWRYTAQVSSDTSVSGWMMMALKSGDLSGLDVPEKTYTGINTWLGLAQQSPDRPDRYRYNPYAPDTVQQRHGRTPTPTMTAVGMLMRMYSGWRRDNEAMKSAADYLLEFPPEIGTRRLPKRDAYYWYYATQVMFHMGGEHWEKWASYLNPMLLKGQIKTGSQAGSWDPRLPVPDRWSPHAGRLYVTTMNLLNLEVYYRHLPIYEDTAYEDTAYEDTAE